MKKFIIAGMAVAMLVIPSIASADVPRYQSQSATFTATQPANEYNQWNRLWTRDFTITTNPCDGTFTGTSVVNGDDANGTFDQQVPHADNVPDETVTGKFSADRKTVTFTVTRVGGAVVWGLTNAPMDSNTITVATLNVSTEQPVEFKVTAPVFSNTSTYKNHGEYVKAMGGGDDAAHSCIGMPINSKQGK
jgi:hypothetical protein